VADVVGGGSAVGAGKLAPAKTTLISTIQGAVTGGGAKPTMPAMDTWLDRRVTGEAPPGYVKPDEEVLAYSYNWHGWFGAFLLGWFDGRIIPDGYHLVSFTLCRCWPSWGVFLTIRNNDGQEKKVGITDHTREKAVRSFRQQAKAKSLNWVAKR